MRQSLHQLCRWSSLNDKKNPKCPDDQLGLARLVMLIYDEMWLPDLFCPHLLKSNIYTEWWTMFNFFLFLGHQKQIFIQDPPKYQQCYIICLCFVIVSFCYSSNFPGIEIRMYCLKSLYLHCLSSCSHDACGFLFCVFTI